MLKKSLASKLLAACLAVASLGTVTILTATPAWAESNIGLRGAPPLPRYEAMPPARRGHIWVPGHWEIRGARQVWVGGVWLKERPGYRYDAPAWVQHDGRWEMHRGGWRRGDRDGDGVPNGADRRPNDPYRR